MLRGGSLIGEVEFGSDVEIYENYLTLMSRYYGCGPGTELEEVDFYSGDVYDRYLDGEVCESELMPVETSFLHLTSRMSDYICSDYETVAEFLEDTGAEFVITDYTFDELILLEGVRCVDIYEASDSMYLILNLAIVYRGRWKYTDKRLLFKYEGVCREDLAEEVLYSLYDWDFHSGSILPNL